MQQGSLTFTGNYSAPAAAVGADNGLSVDGVSSNVVFGQDIGAVGDPAALLSDREIPLDAFFINVLGIAGSNNLIRLGFDTLAGSRFGVDVVGDSSIGSPPTISFTDPVGSPVAQQFTFRLDADTFYLDNFLGNVINITALGMFIARNLVVNAEIRGGRTITDTAISISTGGIVDGRTLYTNRGAVGVITFSLPPFSVVGVDYTFTIVAAFGIIIDAPPGVTIRIGGVVSPAGGTVSAGAVGDSVRLVQISATEWQAVAVVGAWATP